MHLVPYSLENWKQLRFWVWLNASTHALLLCNVSQFFKNTNIKRVRTKSYVWCSRNSLKLFYWWSCFVTPWAFCLPARWALGGGYQAGREAFRSFGAAASCKLGVWRWFGPRRSLHAVEGTLVVSPVMLQATTCTAPYVPHDMVCFSTPMTQHFISKTPAFRCYPWRQGLSFTYLCISHWLTQCLSSMSHGNNTNL